MIGWLFWISGVVGLITTFMMRNAPGFWWSLLSAILGIVGGIVLLGLPVLGAVSLTLLSGRWSWMMVSGVVDLVLAFIVVTGLPGTAAWTLGLLVGINMLFRWNLDDRDGPARKQQQRQHQRPCARVRGA